MRTAGGFGWKKVVPWESFVGAECDTVIYVGTGSLEAFSRAKLKLMIITVPTTSQGRDSFHNFDACLRQSVEKNLLQKQILVEDPNDPEKPLLDGPKSPADSKEIPSNNHWR